MPRPVPEPDWPALLEVWQDPEAQALLSQPASQDASTNPRIQQLLSRTRKILVPLSVREIAITYKHAAAAVKCEAIALLAKLLHLVQQQPILSKEFAMATSNDPRNSVWACVVESLRFILKAIRVEMSTVNLSAPGVFPDPRLADHARLEASCRQQLEEAAGKEDNLSCHWLALSCLVMPLSKLLPSCRGKLSNLICQQV